jgi:DNA polymerase-3 subunit delta'
MVGALFPWQVAAAREALARRDTWPHGLLLTGSRGIGKRALAMHFARALLCERPRPDGSACGACASCGYVNAGQHPDLRVLELVEVDEDGEAKPLSGDQDRRRARSSPHGRC